MNLFISFILTCILLMGGVAMSMNDDVQIDKERIFMMPEAAGTEITVEGPGIFAVKIKSNPTTGYSWGVDKPSDETVVKFKDVIEDEEETDEPRKMGGPTYELLAFEALNPGQVTVLLKYRRPWEKDVEPQKTFKLTIVVK